MGPQSQPGTFACPRMMMEVGSASRSSPIRSLVQWQSFKKEFIQLAANGQSWDVVADGNGRLAGNRIDALTTGDNHVLAQPATTKSNLTYGQSFKRLDPASGKWSPYADTPFRGRFDEISSRGDTTGSKPGLALRTKSLVGDLAKLIGNCRQMYR